MTIEYSCIHWLAGVYDPCSASRSTRKELMLSHNAEKQRVLSMTRDGDVVTVRDPKSGRAIEVPFSQVRYAQVSERQTTSTTAPTTPSTRNDSSKKAA